MDKEIDLELVDDMATDLFNTQKDLKLAKINEAYHRKQMEYCQEQIKILSKKE